MSDNNITVLSADATTQVVGGDAACDAAWNAGYSHWWANGKVDALQSDCAKQGYHAAAFDSALMTRKAR